MIKNKVLGVVILGVLATFYFKQHQISDLQADLELLNTKFEKQIAVTDRQSLELSNSKLDNDHQQNVINQLIALRKKDESETKQLEDVAASERVSLQEQVVALKGMIKNEMDCANQFISADIISLLKQF